MKMLCAALAATCLLGAAAPAASLSWKQAEPGRWQLSEGDRPVLVYNASIMKRDGAPADRQRCCYVYPLYSPAGVSMLDDFPADHYHHRGLFWAWPQVRINGKRVDLWLMKGIRHETVKVRVASGVTLHAQNRWVMGAETVVDEAVELSAQPAAGTQRELRLVVTLTAKGQPVTLEGSAEPSKAYGGVSMRFAERTNTAIASSDGEVRKDEDLNPHAAASFTATYGGKTVKVSITPDATNPDTPNVWCLRYYGFMGASWPGRQPATLQPGRPVRLAYKITVADLPAPVTMSRVLVYTRNYTPDGKGYVHDNIATSVAAIKKIGEQHHFEVDASDDPTIFNDESLKRYRAIVFSNSNNEAFSDDSQRAAFQRYIRNGGGVVGIHSATGSERKWPYFWSVMGAKFMRHPPLQPFQVRVADANHPATRDLPVQFEWNDECYYHEQWVPGSRVLLVTDPQKLRDLSNDGYPGDRFAGAMPLAWSRTFDGGRQFYTALGHKMEHYSNPLLLKLITGGILWAMGERPL